MNGLFGNIVSTEDAGGYDKPRFLSIEIGVMSGSPTHVAQRFAELLDRRRYDDLASLLDKDCVYEFRGGTIQGVKTIIETYRANTEWGFGVFDRIEFESEIVSQSGASANVRFSDHLFLGDAEHRHVCEQTVTIDDTGRIIRIVHRDLEGEIEALNAFMQKCGVSRPSDQAGS